MQNDECRMQNQELAINAPPDWVSVEKNRHKYLFEHGRGKNFKSFWKTYWRSSFLRRFWNDVTTYRLTIAFRQYLRVHLPLATVVASQLIAFLITFLVLVQIVDFSRRI